MMHSQKQILLIGATFIAIFSILFFNIRAKYNFEYEITKKEIAGIKEIRDIYKLDILLKSVRGLKQLADADAALLKKNLFIDERKILKSIEKLQDKEIEQFYKNNIHNNLSKMQMYTNYTQLLKLLGNKRIDKADSSYLLFEANRENYFLIATTVLDIPQIIENIGKVRALGIGLHKYYYGDNKSINYDEVSFLIESNLKAFLDKLEEMKYTIAKLDYKEQSIINPLLDLIIADFYVVRTMVSKLKDDATNFDSKNYFLETSKLVNKIYSLFSTSKGMLTQKLKDRKVSLRNKLLAGTVFYIVLMLITLMSIFIIYKKSYKDSLLNKKKKENYKFIQVLQDDYIKENNLKEICTKSLNHIIEHFKAINGSLYLLDAQNEKLYLGAAYGIKHTNLSQVLDLHENLIAENILEKKIKILDINNKVNLGNIEIYCTKLITIPIIEFDKSIGTIQLSFDDNFKNIDIEFLETVVSLMATYINKAQKEEESLKYLKLIDKNVLISKTDLDGNIIEVSEQFSLLSQYTKKELIGKTHRILKHKDMKKEVFAAIWRTITKGDTWNGEIKNRKKDGSFYWIYTSISPDRDINGNIIGYTAIRTDITDQKKIEQIAITDGLTSLYNRRYFDDIFPQQIRINTREKGLLAFLLIDIDHFKQYNDTYGHQAGDTTLKAVAIALKNTLKRPSDYTFRLGGEEFGLLYHIKNKEDALDIANEAKQNVENLHIEHTGNSASKFVTISSGLYLIASNDDATVDAIYKKADEALYTSKQNGRNKVSIALEN